MKLTDIRRKPNKKSTKNMLVAEAVDSAGQYPWGMRINLEKEELAALDLKSRNFNVGDKVEISAIGEVVELRESASRKYQDSTVVLQITKIAVNEKGGEKKAIDTGFFAGAKGKKE